MTIFTGTYRATIAAVLLMSASAAQAQSNNNVSDVTGPNVSDITGPNVSDITGTDTASARARQAGVDESDLDQLAEDIGEAHASCSTSGGDCTNFYSLLNQAQEILQPE